MKVLFRAEAEDLDKLSLNAHDLLTEIDERFYAIGCWSPEGRIEVTDKRGFIYKYSVKQETKAIHFEDMLDSKGNKIFASIQKNGKGGDLLSHKYFPLGAKHPYYRHKILFYSQGDIYAGVIKTISGYEHSLGEEELFQKMKDVCQHSSFMFNKYEVIGINNDN